MANKKAVAIAVVAAAAAAAYCVWQNNDIMTTNLVYHSPKVPEAFDGYKIALLSDLHSKMFGRDQRRLIEAVRKAEPDMIALTGDFIDRVNPDINSTVQFVKQAVKLAPVYYVPGNHEAKIKQHYSVFKKKLADAGVILLENTKDVLYRDGASMEVAGVNDPAFTTRSHNTKIHAYHMNENIKLAQAGDKTSSVRILLSHRPELVEIYKKKNINLALTGHAHGGQWRLPLLGGLFSPNQGILPKLASGMQTFGDTTLVVSRGLGNSGFPIRIGNRPEVVTVTLTNVQEA